MDLLLTCCRHDPLFITKTEVINICPGCDKRFGNDYQNTTTISLWEILTESDFFTFPNYHGKHMSIIDACPTRNKEKIHLAIRTILTKMNIILDEPKNTGTKGTCCGDSFYGVIPTEKVKEQMTKRTSEMPSDDVVTYCVSCAKAIYIGGKKPHYLIDLLFENETVPKTFEPDEWHKKIDQYIEQH
jgi:Fe-S oxidoreductase